MSSSSDTRSKAGRFTVIFKYLRQYRGYLLFGAVAVILSNVLGLTTPYIIKIIYDMLEQNQAISTVVPYLLLMIALAASSGFFRYLMRRTIIWMSRKLEYELRGEMVNHLLKLSPSYYDNNRTGDIMARLTNDLEAVRMMVGPGIMQMSNTIITVIVALAFMIALSPKLTLYALIPAAVLPIVVNRLGTLSHKRYIKIQEHFADLTAAAQENLAGVRVVKAYRQENKEFNYFAGMSLKYFDLNMDMGKLMATFYPMIAFVGAGLVLTVLYFGGKGVINNEMSLGSLVAFFVYLNMLLWPIIAVGWVISLYQRGIASLDRINEILHTEPDIPALDNGHKGPMRGDIEIRHLTFSYDDRIILNDISLTIKAGETIGIVGMTGSGKTTLVSLLGRLYPVHRGQIFIDGVDINDWSLHALRSGVGFATQESFLFSDSLTDNIRFGRDDSDLSKVTEMAEMAALSKDIKTFPRGYDTIIGERGITLSGGQKQRTAIARALLIDPAVLVLDDATSSVDTETEDQINSRIHIRDEKCTTIIISHRVSSVKEADQIIYLKDGKIAERGGHHELIAVDGYYAALYRSQLMAKELETLE
ncbi:MAG: ABC transporter ATP-binding protein [candidate division Zixibacteria bacterium]|nr:ABC transporter ATP-binding protein [candidate division Zixibacteria bacterium]